MVVDDVPLQVWKHVEAEVAIAIPPDAVSVAEFRAAAAAAWRAMGQEENLALDAWERGDRSTAAVHEANKASLRAEHRRLCEAATAAEERE